MGVPIAVGGYIALEKLLLWLGVGTVAVGAGAVIVDNMNEANKAVGSSNSGISSYTDACSSCQPPPEEDDDDENKNRGERNKRYQKQAEKMGYRKVSRGSAPFNSHGENVFYNGRNYISPDRDGHNVSNGWKVFNGRGDRQGTYNWDLSRQIKG